MIEEYLIEKGYSKFSPSVFQHEKIETCFQKCFKDEKGKKYFITINKWKPWTHPHTGDIIGPAYECNVQLYQKDTHKAIDILFHSDWEIEAVEEYIKDIFDSGKFDYYETYNN